MLFMNQPWDLQTTGFFMLSLVILNLEIASLMWLLVIDYIYCTIKQTSTYTYFGKQETILKNVSLYKKKQTNRQLNMN